MDTKIIWLAGVFHALGVGNYIQCATFEVQNGVIWCGPFYMLSKR